MLANECKKAFEAAGIESSEHPQIKKAVNLCSLYAPKSHISRRNDAASSRIGKFWKSDEDLIEDKLVDRKEAAISKLGKSLVDTLLEENHQPPDVSLL